MNFSDFPELVPQLAAKLKEPLPSKEALAMMFPNIKSLPPIPEDVRLSAVMLLLFIKNDKWHILAIKRTEDGRAHSGQIGFPGGRAEPEDLDLQATALRETMEEVGIFSNTIEVLGALSPVLVTVSNYRVFPFVGFVSDLQITQISSQEVQSVLELPLSVLFEPSAKVIAEVGIQAYPTMKRKVNAYQLPDGTIIWGATALMIAELELLLR